MLVSLLAGAPQHGQVVLYRRPLEHRARTRKGLRILVFRTLVEQLHALTEIPLEELDPEGWATDTVGRRKRLYDKPRSPYQRLLAAGVLNPAQETELAAYKATLKPVAMQRRITEIQQELTRLAGRKTARLEQHIAWKAPDPAGLKTRAS